MRRASVSRSTGGVGAATTLLTGPQPAPNGTGGTPMVVLARVDEPDGRRPYELKRHEWLVAAVVGVWLGLMGVVSLVAGVWAWAMAERAGAAAEQVRWVGPDFTATAATGALVLAAVGGVIGSFVHVASLFATRVGRRTFEVSYFWWYLLRPIEAALVAMVFVAALRSGLLALGTPPTGGGTTVLAFLAGGLAGLFTDRVMQRLRGLLGATKTDMKASEQAPPLEAGGTGEQPRPAAGVVLGSVTPGDAH